MRWRDEHDFATAMEIVHLVRSFRAVLTANILKYRTIRGSGAVAAFTADVERDRARYANKFLGIREPSLASFAKCAEQLVNDLSAKAITQANAMGEVEIQYQA